MMVPSILGMFVGYVKAMAKDEGFLKGREDRWLYRAEC